jgi:DNA-binding Xre family transcriptional regulator
MAETAEVVATLKQLLRANRTTYARLATGLGMSEANVKRMFTSGHMTLERIEAICHLIGISLGDLFHAYESSRQRINCLTEAQEQELVADTRLLLVAVCVRNQLGYEEILREYRIASTELIRCLARLDRLKIIDLLPNNAIKLRIDDNFRWLPRGPIERFYEQAVEREFLAGAFDAEPNRRMFLFGLLSEASQALIANRLQALSKEFILLHRQDGALPMAQRRNVGLLLAMREWQFSVFAPYSRT